MSIVPCWAVYCLNSFLPSLWLLQRSPATSVGRPDTHRQWKLQRPSPNTGQQLRKKKLFWPHSATGSKHTSLSYQQLWNSIYSELQLGADEGPVDSFACGQIQVTVFAVVFRITFQTLLGIWGQIPCAELIVEELDDGEGETLGVCHDDGGSDVSVLWDGRRSWRDRTKTDPLANTATLIYWI